MLLKGARAVGGGNEGQRFLGIHIQPHAGVLRAEVAGTKRPRAAAAIARGHAEHNETGEIFVHRPEAVGGPRADGRVRALARMAAGLEGELRAVIVVNGPERAHHGEIIRAGADVLEPVADDQSALAVGLVAGLEREDDLAIAVARIAADHVFVLRLDHGFVRRVGDGFAGVFVQLGLHIKALHVTHAAAEENPDHRLRLGRGVRPAVGRLPRGRVRIGGGAGHAVLEEQCAEREAGETHAGVGKERAARDAGAGLRCGVVFHGQFSSELPAFDAQPGGRINLSGCAPLAESGQTLSAALPGEPDAAAASY